MNEEKTLAVEEFLKESNAIEGVYDDESLEFSLKAWGYLLEQKEITIPVIMGLHRILMHNQEIPLKYKGHLRQIPVYIGGHEAMSHKLIPTRLSTLAMNMWLHPKNWKEHHIEFEKIHPFIDGNGRTGRMLMNWERLKVGLPLLIIHEGNEQFDYYKWFK